MQTDSAAVAGQTRSIAPFPLLAGLLVAAAFGWTYYATFGKLMNYWASDDLYSYGFLVPLISGYIVWINREGLRELPRTPSLGLGGLVLAGGLLALLVGQLSSTNLLEELSIVVSLAGLVLVLFGTHVTRFLAFPLAYLLAMVPFWDSLTSRLHAPFQLYSAKVGVGALRLFDLPVYSQGIYIELPNITLEVAEACSGVNNLIAVLCIGVPMSYLFISGWTKRAVVVVSAILIALLSNGLRVAMVSMFAYYDIRGADGDVHGPFALLRTLAISGVGFLVLFWMIARFSDRDALIAPPLAKDAGQARTGGGRILRTAAPLVALALLSGFLIFERWHQVAPAPLATRFVGLPNTIGEWQYRAGGSFSSNLDDLSFDAKASRNYVSADGAEVNLFFGYYEQQTQGRELVGYSVQSALWKAAQAPRTTALGDGMRVREFITAQDGQQYYVAYWYALDSRVTPDNYAAKLYTAWNSLAYRRSNGGLAVVKARLQAGESVEAARLRLRPFVEGALGASAASFRRMGVAIDPRPV